MVDNSPANAVASIFHLIKNKIWQAHTNAGDVITTKEFMNLFFEQVINS